MFKRCLTGSFPDAMQENVAALDEKKHEHGAPNQQLSFDLETRASQIYALRGSLPGGNLYVSPRQPLHRIDRQFDAHVTDNVTQVKYISSVTKPQQPSALSCFL